MSDEELERRISIFLILLLILLGVMAFKLGWLQIVQGEEFAVKARGNRLRILPIKAPRGEIVDRQGRVLAGNRPAFVATLVYTEHPMEKERVEELARILALQDVKVEDSQTVRRLLGGKLEEVTRYEDISAGMVERYREAIEGRKAVIARAFQGLSRRPLNPQVIGFDLHPMVATTLREKLYRFPGVNIRTAPLRYYPHGEVGAHAIGYVSSLTKRQLERLGDWGLEEVGYEGNDIVGQSGVEALRAFDPLLRGEDGGKQVETDSRGRPVRVLGEVRPQPGGNLRLTVDQDLQEAAHYALQQTITRLRQGFDPVNWDSKTGLPVPFGEEGEKIEIQDGPNEQVTGGAAVVLKVDSGEVLAMASVPSFDPNRFAQSPHLLEETDRKQRWNEYFEKLRTSENTPLLNRAIQQTYAPGSTYKPIVALAALEQGYNLGQIRCRGSYRSSFFNVVKADWRTHGRVDLEEAIKKSCNVFFYRLGEMMDLDDVETKLAEAAQPGDTTIKVEEVSGFIPGDFIRLGPIESPRAEIRVIKEVDERTKTLILGSGQVDGQVPLRNVHPEGQLVHELTRRWNDPTAWLAREFGLGEETGLTGVAPDIEVGGSVETWFDYARRLEDRPGCAWCGNTLNAVIGQTQFVTPLQMANYTAALANGGTLYRPLLVKETISSQGERRRFEKRVLNEIELSPASLARVKRGMKEVVQPEGTAHWRFRDWFVYDFGVEIAAKTGTAQVKGKSPHGWFVAYAPADDPEIAVAVVVEHGGGGYIAAAPVARAIMDEYFGYRSYWKQFQPEDVAD